MADWEYSVGYLTDVTEVYDESDDSVYSFAASKPKTTTETPILPIRKAKWSSCSDVASDAETPLKAEKVPYNLLDVKAETASDKSSSPIHKAKWISCSDVSSDAGTPLNAKKMSDIFQEVEVQVFDEAADSGPSVQLQERRFSSMTEFEYGVGYLTDATEVYDGLDDSDDSVYSFAASRPKAITQAPFLPVQKAKWSSSSDVASDAEIPLKAKKMPDNFLDVKAEVFDDAADVVSSVQLPAKRFMSTAEFEYGVGYLTDATEVYEESDSSVYSFAASKPKATTETSILPIRKAKWSSSSDVASNAGTPLKAKTASREYSLPIQKAKWISCSDVSSDAGSPLNSKKMLGIYQKVEVQMFDDAADVDAAVQLPARRFSSMAEFEYGVGYLTDATEVYDGSDDSVYSFAASRPKATTETPILSIQKAKWSSCSDVAFNAGTPLIAKKVLNNFVDVKAETAADKSFSPVQKLKWISCSDVSSNAGTPVNAKQLLDDSQGVEVQVFDGAADIVASAHSHVNLDNNENYVNGCRLEIPFGSSISKTTGFSTWAEKEKVKLEYPYPVFGEYAYGFGEYAYDGDVDELVDFSVERYDSSALNHPINVNMTADEKIHAGIYNPCVKVLRSGPQYVSTESLVCNASFDDYDDISVCDMSFTSNISNDFEDYSLEFKEEYVDPDAEY